MVEGTERIVTKIPVGDRVRAEGHKAYTTERKAAKEKEERKE